MHTKYLSSLLANASEWGLSIDSETQPSGNAGEAFHNTILLIVEDASCLYGFSVNLVRIRVRIRYHHAGFVDQEHSQPWKFQPERWGIPGDIQYLR